jgi:maltose 6'-phosphate phosphatase
MNFSRSLANCGKMKAVQLLYAKNVISGKEEAVQQILEFFILIENIAYQKQVEVFWAGQDGVWRTTKAEYHASVGQNLELWRAKAIFSVPGNGFLPGNIQFALRYRVLGEDYWDNNYSRDYIIEADSGILVHDEVSLLNLGYCQHLQLGQKVYFVMVAVRRSLSPRRVDIVWTTDGWITQNQAPCFLQKDFWCQTTGSQAGNPNRYRWEMWVGKIGIGQAYRVEYAIVCDTDTGKIWDNNFGKNYLARREPLKILTLNLHCYQENDQDAKFSEIARAISELSVDIICFQEVGEYWNDGRGDWNSNAAKIIWDHLRKSYHLSYHLYTDWSHIGFARFCEGSAILSKYRFLGKESEYISNSHDIYSIHARKAVMVQVHVPYMGFVNVFSVHLSWWSDGFREQFETLRRYANLRHGPDVAATFLCGDFNAAPGSEGYALVTGSQEYEDQFLKAISGQSSQRLRDDHRIDYIFMKGNSNLIVSAVRVLFTGEAYRRVSDHCAYYMEFEPN